MYRRRRYYGKPPPPKAQVQAHYKFYELVNDDVKREGVKMKIVRQVDLDKNEVRILKRILYAEYNDYQKRISHAASHGQEYYDGDSATLANLLLTKIDPDNE